MSPDASELHAMAAGWGGVFDRSALVGSFGDLLTDLVDSGNVMVDGLRQHMIAPWASRPLHVDFTNSEEVNALTQKGEDTDYVLVTIGAVGKIYGTMYGMLSTPTFLPEIGNPNQEETPNPSLAGGFPPMPLLGPEDGDEPVEFCLPADQTRATFAMHLASTALHFLLYHEIGHIMAGHLELLEHQGFAAVIPEVGASTLRGGMAPPLCVLECDADAFAAHIGSFVDLNSGSDGLWKEVYGWNREPGRDAGFIAYAVAISILVRMLGTNGFVPESLDTTKHPPPAVRSCLAISRSMALAAIAGRFAMDRLPQLCRDSVFHVEETWVVLDLPGQQFGESSTWAEHVGRVSTELGREYERWKTDLCKLARLPTRWHNSWPAGARTPSRPHPGGSPAPRLPSRPPPTR